MIKGKIGEVLKFLAKEEMVVMEGEISKPPDLENEYQSSTLTQCPQS